MENTQNLSRDSKGIFCDLSRSSEGIFPAVPRDAKDIYRGKIITQEMVEGENRGWLASLIERFIRRMMKERVESSKSKVQSSNQFKTQTSKS